MSSVELRAGVVRVFISLLFFVFPCVEQSGVGSRVRRRIGRVRRGVVGRENCLLSRLWEKHVGERLEDVGEMGCVGEDEGRRFCGCEK